MGKVGEIIQGCSHRVNEKIASATPAWIREKYSNLRSRVRAKVKKIEYKAVSGLSLLFVGALLIGLGGIWYPLKVQEAVNREVVNRIVVRESNETTDAAYASWIQNEYYGKELHNRRKRFFLFNLTNPKEVLWGDQKPALKQCGPYVFNVYARKHDVAFNGDDHSVTFKVYKFMVFDLKWSLGNSLDDRLVTANLPYSQILVNLKKQKLTETYLSGRFAHQALDNIKKFLHGSFLAHLKRDALSRYLSKMYAQLRYQEVPWELSTRYPEMRAAAVPVVMNHVYAAVRVQTLPKVLYKTYSELSVLGIWQALTKVFYNVRRAGVPRVLDGIYRRMKSEGTPAMLTQLINKRRHAMVPEQLGEVYPRVKSLTTPGQLSSIFVDACMEAVPQLLSVISRQIIEFYQVQQDVSIAQARLNMVTQWRLGVTAIDLNPLLGLYGEPRIGFEIDTSINIDDARRPLDDVASYLLSASNAFSFLNSDDPNGWKMWLRVMDRDEQAIEAIRFGISEEVDPGPTRAQLLFIADWLKSWISNDITILDRLTQWKEGQNLQNSGGEVDLDQTTPGIQGGFEMENTNVGRFITESSARYLWNVSQPYAFTNKEGWLVWEKAMSFNPGDSMSVLTKAHPDLVSDQILAVVQWLSLFQNNQRLLNYVHAHWTHAQCLPPSQKTLYNVTTTVHNATYNVTTSSPYNITVHTPCETIDLDEHTPGIQGGFELSMLGDQRLYVPDPVVAYLWDARNQYSFLNSTGYALWQTAVRTSVSREESLTTLVTAINKDVQFGTVVERLTKTQATAICDWLTSWVDTAMLTKNSIVKWNTDSCKTDESVNFTTYFGYEYINSSDYEAVEAVQNETYLLNCSTNGTNEAFTEVTQRRISPHITNNVTVVNTSFKCWNFSIETGLKPFYFGSQQIVTFAPQTHNASITGLFSFSFKPSAKKGTNPLENSKTPIPVTSDAATFKTALELLPSVTLALVTEMNTSSTNNISWLIEFDTVTYNSYRGEPANLLQIDTTAVTVSDAKPVVSTVTEVQKGHREWRMQYQTYYNRSTITDVHTTLSYSCDLKDIEPDVPGMQTGFENNPTGAPELFLDDSVVDYLWDSNEPYSFLSNSSTGYMLWTYVGTNLGADASAAATTMPEGSNYSKLDLAIQRIIEGVRNTTTGGANISQAQVTNVATWLVKQQHMPWFSAQLQERWRLGDAKHSVAGQPGLELLDLEPYTEGLQPGFEVAVVSNRSVHGGDNSISIQYSEYLWNKSMPLSFVSQEGYQLWITAAYQPEDDCTYYCGSVLTCGDCIASAKLKLAMPLQALQCSTMQKFEWFLQLWRPMVKKATDAKLTSMLSSFDADSSATISGKELQAMIDSKLTAAGLDTADTTAVLASMNKLLADKRYYIMYQGIDICQLPPSQYATVVEDQLSMMNSPPSYELKKDRTCAEEGVSVEKIVLVATAQAQCQAFCDVDAACKGFDVYVADGSCNLHYSKRLSSRPNMGMRCYVKKAPPVTLLETIWLNWMESVARWLHGWYQNPLLERDVLRKWIDYSCRDDDVSNVVNVSVRNLTINDTCVPSSAVNQSAPSTASSSSYPFFEYGELPPAQLVYDQYSPRTTMTVLTSTVNVTCEPYQVRVLVNASAGNETVLVDMVREVTTHTSATSKQFSCDIEDISITRPGLDGGFELDPKRKYEAQLLAHPVSLKAAQQLWDDKNPGSFKQQKGFAMWKDSTRDPAKIDEVLGHINAPLPVVDRIGKEQFNVLRDWLFEWIYNPLTHVELQEEWGQRNKATADKPLDVDENRDGIQAGFEINWDAVDGLAVTKVDAKYLWDSAATYSFLNPGLPYDPSTGGATGFFAWSEVYEGYHMTTAQLVDGTPRNLSMQYQKANDTLKGLIRAATNTKPPCKAPQMQVKHVMNVSLSLALGANSSDESFVITVQTASANLTTLPMALDTTASELTKRLTMFDFSAVSNFSFLGVAGVSKGVLDANGSLTYNFQLESETEWGGMAVSVGLNRSAGLAPTSTGHSAIALWNATFLKSYFCPPRNGLTIPQIERIAEWLFHPTKGWVSNPMLLVYLHEQWENQRVTTQTGKGSIAVPTFDLGSRMANGDLLVNEGFPRQAPLFGFEMAAGAGLLEFHRAQLWDIRSPVSFLSSDGFGLWRDVHKGAAPETGLYPWQRVPRVVNASAVTIIQNVTNSAPSCLGNSSVSTTEVFENYSSYGTELSLTVNRVNYSETFAISPFCTSIKRGGLHPVSECAPFPTASDTALSVGSRTCTAQDAFGSFIGVGNQCNVSFEVDAPVADFLTANLDCLEAALFADPEVLLDYVTNNGTIVVDYSAHQVDYETLQSPLRSLGEKVTALQSILSRDGTYLQKLATRTAFRAISLTQASPKAALALVEYLNANPALLADLKQHMQGHAYSAAITGGVAGEWTSSTVLVDAMTWTAVAPNGKVWMLNQTVTTTTVHHVCPAENSMSPDQIYAVAEWLMSWADHPITLSTLQERWWRSKTSVASAYEHGFELHLLYPGEEYMSMQTKPGLAPSSTNVTLSTAAAAYLWDADQEYSFLNLGAWEEHWLEVLQGRKSWQAIAEHIPDLYSDGSGNAGTKASQPTMEFVEDGGVRMHAILDWLRSWAVHPHLQQSVQRQWRVKSRVHTDVLYVIPDTFAPTLSPTSAPTRTPTAPTLSPTPSPTPAPTAAPTAAPTPPPSPIANAVKITSAMQIQGFTVATFDASAQQGFKASVASKMGVERTDLVEITNVTSASAKARRRLLAGEEIVIDFYIEVPSVAAANRTADLLQDVQANATAFVAVFAAQIKNITGTTPEGLAVSWTAPPVLAAVFSVKHTSAPTAGPTATPSAAPSAIPTFATPAPTPTPTSVPSPAPTPVPTTTPTPVPTNFCEDDDISLVEKTGGDITQCSQAASNHTLCDQSAVRDSCPLSCDACNPNAGSSYSSHGSSSYGGSSYAAQRRLEEQEEEWHSNGGGRHLLAYGGSYGSGSSSYGSSYKSGDDKPTVTSAPTPQPTRVPTIDPYSLLGLDYSNDLLGHQGKYHEKIRPPCTPKLLNPEFEDLGATNCYGFEVVDDQMSKETAAILWDPTDKRSFLHPDGFVVWTEGIQGCMTSDIAGFCRSSPLSEAEKDRVEWASKYLSQETGLTPGQINHIRDAWLKNWLDNTDLTHSAELLGGFVVDKVETMRDLGYLQLGNAGVTRKTYKPTSSQTWRGDKGSNSIKLETSHRYFRPGESGSILDGQLATEYVTPPLGYQEVSAYCEYGWINNPESYAQFTQCNTTADLGVSKHLLDLFTDTRLVSSNVATTGGLAGLKMRKGNYAVMKFLDQPFASRDECETIASLLRTEFFDFKFNTTDFYNVEMTLLSADGQIVNVKEKREAMCKEYIDGFWADHVYRIAKNQRFDMKQYIKYIATKFVLEPDVLEKGGGYFTSQKVGDLVVGGYEDPLVKMLRQQGVVSLTPKEVPFDPDIKSATAPLTSYAWNYSKPDPKTDTAQLLAATMAPRTCHTGVRTPYSSLLNDLSNFTKWDGQPRIETWGTDVSVEGSDGSQFAPYFDGKDINSRSVAKANEFKVWSTISKRPLSIEYEEDVTRFGLELRRFKLTSFPRFDTDGSSDESSPMGLVDISNHRQGLPLFLGFPHFLYGVLKDVKDGVTGLEPVEADHETIYDIEPMTGTTMNYRSRMQLTLKSQKTATWYRDIKEPHCAAQLDSSCALFLPLYWTEDEAYTTPGAASKFKSDVYFELQKKRKLPIVAFFIGALMIFASFWLLVLSFRQRFAVAPAKSFKKRRIRKQGKGVKSNRIAAATPSGSDQYKSVFLDGGNSRTNGPPRRQNPSLDQ